MQRDTENAAEPELPDPVPANPDAVTPDLPAAVPGTPDIPVPNEGGTDDEDGTDGPDEDGTDGPDGDDEERKDGGEPPGAAPAAGPGTPAPQESTD